MNRLRNIEQSDFLTSVAVVTIKDNRLPREEIAEKHAFREALEKIAVSTVQANLPQDWQTATPTLKLESYGSLSNSFGTKGCDADLLLTAKSSLGDEEYQEIPDSFKRSLERALLDAGIGARLLTNTRVPILRVYERPDADFLAALRDHRNKWETGESHEVKVVLPDSAPLPPALPGHVDNLSANASIQDEEALQIPLPDSPPAAHAKLEPTGDFGISCDINFSNRVALKNTRLLWRYGQYDERVRQMGIFVKSWAKARDINTPYVGSLSSYGYILMVLHYLMNVEYPPVIPNLQAVAHDDTRHPIRIFEDFDITFLDDPEAAKRALANIPRNTKPLGALLKGFYQYYSIPTGFNWMHDVISVRSHGGILKKASKGWTQASQSNNVRLRYLLAIEDPFEIEHNIARTVGHNGIVTIRDEFRRAWYIISNIQKVPNPSSVVWVYQKQDQTISSGMDLVEKADHGDLLRKDQEAGRRLRQMKREAEAQHKAALGTQNDTKSGLESESGTSCEHELNEPAHSSPSRAITMLTQEPQQDDKKRTALKSWNDFSQRLVEDDNSSDEVLTKGLEHESHNTREDAREPHIDSQSETTVVESRKIQIDNSHTTDLESSERDWNQENYTGTRYSEKIESKAKVTSEAARSETVFSEVESVNGLAAMDSTAENRRPSEVHTVDQLWSADHNDQQRRASCPQSPPHQLSDIVGPYIEWDAGTEGGRLLLWRDRKIRSASWAGASAGDKGKLFAQFPYNPHMTYGQLTDYNRVLQKLYKFTIHARAIDDETPRHSLDTRERSDAEDTVESMSRSTMQVRTHAGHGRSLSQARVGKYISWTTENDAGQWLHWRDRLIRDGDWRQVSGAFDGLFYKLNLLYLHDPNMTNARLEEYNMEIQELIGDTRLPRPEMDREHADQLKVQMHTVLNQVIERRGESVHMYHVPLPTQDAGDQQISDAQDDSEWQASTALSAPSLKTNEGVDESVGPIPWSLSTSAGVWLTWRDKKLACGSWQDQLAVDSVLRRLSELFPYDTSMSAMELASKNDEICRHFTGVHVPGRTNDSNDKPLYRAICSVLQERSAQGIPPKSQILLDLLQTHRSSSAPGVDSGRTRTDDQWLAFGQQKPQETDARVIADVRTQLNTNHNDGAAFIRQKRLKFYGTSEFKPELEYQSDHNTGSSVAGWNQVDHNETLDHWREPTPGSWDSRDYRVRTVPAWSPDTAGEHESIPLTTQNLTNMQKIQSSEQMWSGEGLIMELRDSPTVLTDHRFNVPSSTLPNTWRLNYRDRHEDPRVLPIPGRRDFAFDPKHLELVAVMQRGGNGCAVRGRRFTIGHGFRTE